MQTFDNRKSCFSETETPDFRQSKQNNNNIINNNSNNTYANDINLSVNTSLALDDTGNRLVTGYKNAIEKIKTQIGYDDLCLSHSDGLIDEIVNIMAEVMTLDKPSYKIEGHLCPTELIRVMYEKITYEKLEAFLLEFENRADKIRNPKAYLISALFNIPSTADTALMNRVNYDINERRQI